MVTKNRKRLEELLEAIKKSDVSTATDLTNSILKEKIKNLIVQKKRQIKLA